MIRRRRIWWSWTVGVVLALAVNCLAAAPGYKTFRVVALEYRLPPGAAQVNFATQPVLFTIGAESLPKDWHPMNQVRDVVGPFLDADGDFTVAFTFDNYEGGVPTGTFHCFPVCERLSERRLNKQLEQLMVGKVRLVKPKGNPSFVVKDAMIAFVPITRQPGQPVGQLPTATTGTTSTTHGTTLAPAGP